MFIERNKKYFGRIGIAGIILLIILGLINLYIFDFTEIYLSIISIALIVFLLLLGLNSQN